MNKINKNCETLYKALQQFPKKKISLNELRDLCNQSDTYREQILELTAQGVLTPIKCSGTDGNLQRTLYMRYTIKFEAKTKIPSEEIYSLHPRLTANGYLIRNREKFIIKTFYILLVNG